MTATDVEWTLALILIMLGLFGLFAIGMKMMDAADEQNEDDE